MIGLHLDDAALALARDGVCESVDPSIVQIETVSPDRFGAPASDLVRRRPLAVSTRHWSELSRDGENARPDWRAIASAELTRRLASLGTPGAIHVAVPATFTAETCGMVLSWLRTAGWSVQGFHDAAALTASACGVERSAIVLEVGLHHVAASLVTRAVPTESSEGGVRRRTVSVRRNSGLLALQEAWLDLVSDSMVRRSRFDPLHDGMQEQRVYDSLMGWAAIAARQGVVDIDWATPTGSLRLPLTRDGFAAAAAPVYRDILAVVHELRSAGAAMDLLLPEHLRDWPGLVDSLDEVRSSHRATFPNTVAARAASLLSNDPSSADSVTLRRGLGPLPALVMPEPWSQGSMDTTISGTGSNRRPSHAIFAERAYPLLEGTMLGIGRMPGPAGIALSDDARAVSRLHCTLRVVDEGVELIDHSRYGTWVNDERVLRRTRVMAGDRIRIGDPGFVIRLLAAGETHGSPP